MATLRESVLIGLCDATIDGKKNVSSFSTSKIGGLPDCLPTITLHYPRCALCSTVLAHVVQVYCPLEASPYHRTINIFACPSPQCYGKSKSWIALRSQCLDSEVKPVCVDQQTKCVAVKEATRDWCEEADDWSLEGEKAPEKAGSAHSDVTLHTGSMSEPEFSSKLKGLSLSEGVEPTLHGLGLVLPGSAAVFCPYYISVLEEADLSGQTDMEHVQRLLQEYEQREGGVIREMDRCENAGEVEKYEKTKVLHGDHVFFRFMKNISVCPEQIVRWDGSPLFITDPPSNMRLMIPPCSQCASPRTFEFQLMPALVSLLTSVDSNSEVVVEFGTVLVFTCRRSCWVPGSDMPMEEFLFVQTDPDHMFFK
ncbi:programmed cell death protein 2-like isoform X2 [Megalops cyprinoides]|uniref:programmed cell death protein 2-like isoform X2 n=1 Tax=Megalops cyprinoides TaxID=118141 RepID=UPI0018642391|nr:programmed cell death protein 2-like isoform X2 [Megalops cyprinoides]